MALPEGKEFSCLTLRHACKCIPYTSVIVEDCLMAVSREAGEINIKSASNMNKAIVIFLKETELADNLVENGLVINNEFFI